MARTVTASIGTAPAPEAQRRVQATHVATIADALARGAVIGPESGAVARLLDSVATLAAWTPDDRTGGTWQEAAAAGRAADVAHLAADAARQSSWDDLQRRADAVAARYAHATSAPTTEPTDAGPLVCAECGTTAAESYVVTFLGGDQDDPTARTEVCEPCHEDLIHGSSEDECFDRHTGEPLPRGRCDTCGAPCGAEEGECTRDRGHAVAVDLDEPRPCADGRCTYLAHDADDLAEHQALNHPRG